jgi:hypothetical protein
MQGAVDHWEGGLRASGGALVPSKSHWYLVDFKWRNDSWKYCTIADNPGALSMLDHTGARVPLERVEVEEARKSLGIMIAGNCQWDDETARLLQASIVWRANLRAGHLSTSDAWYALNHTITKTMEYPMMATYLTKVQCEKVMRPFLNAGLSASGVVKSMPRAVVWGPERYQGLGIRHLYTTQGVEHLLAILRHATRATLTGQLLRTSMDELQLELGLQHSLFSYSYSDYGAIATKSWMTSTWQFLSESNITLIDPFSKPSLASSADCFLMERFSDHGYKGAELRHLNDCRMHLHALRLSDICTADGRYLTNNAMEVQLDPHRSTPFSWPHTRRPSFANRSLWRAAIAKVFLRSTDTQVLCTPLGPLTDMADTWLWLSPSEERLFFPFGSIWTFYQVTSRRSRSINRQYSRGRLVQTLPDDVQAATVSIHGSHARLISVGTTLFPPPSECNRSFSSLIASLSAASQWAVKESLSL